MVMKAVRVLGEHIRALADEGRLRPVLDRSFPLAEALTALQCVAEAMPKARSL
jgi:Zinc-binding dehydrogenase